MLTTMSRQFAAVLTAAQARFLMQSSNSKQIFAQHSSEYIQFDEPDTVINAIREVYEQRTNRNRKQVKRTAVEPSRGIA